MDKKYILGIDEGTSWIKILVVDRNADPVAFETASLATIVPQKD